MAIWYPNALKVPHAPSEKRGILTSSLLAEFLRLMREQGPEIARSFLRKQVELPKDW